MTPWSKSSRPDMPSAFLLDPDRCTGCQACEFACSIENDLGTDLSWREVVTFNGAAIPGIPRFHLSLACNHCAEPACMHSCPALAYSREVSTGAVLIDPNRCIGCRYCSWTCPYGAPRFEQERGVMGKCTFCSHRLDQGLKPACATLCPTGALDFASLPVSELTAPVVGFPQTDLGPAIRIEPVRRRAHFGVVGGPNPEVDSRTVAEPAFPRGITLRSEWSLAAFTFLTALLFATFGAASAGELSVHPILFAAIAIGAATFSLSHLGRPDRAWRAGLNVRRSWLSREVLGFGAFSAGGTAALVAGAPLTSGFGATVAVVGVLTLASADQVYRPVYPGRHPMVDGGGALVTGLYLAGLLLGNLWIAGLAWSVKVASEVHAAMRGGTGSPGRPPVAMAVPRVVLGLVLPAATWIAWGAPLPVWVLLGAIAGEALGRVGFYLRLRVQSPARQAITDLSRRLASSTT